MAKSSCYSCAYQKYKNKRDLAAAQESHRRAYVKKKLLVLEKSRWVGREKRTGFSKKTFHEMFQKQNGVCAICAEALNDRSAADHCHMTGKPRGILCAPCNKGLGSFRDNPAYLEQAIKYLHET